MSVDHASVVAAQVNAQDAAVARVVTRLSSEYLLRILQLTIDVFGDIRAGSLVQAIGAANTAHFNARSEWGRSAAGSNTTFPDAARRPISIARLADSTGLPFESTRRIVQRLVDDGVCMRVEGGVIVMEASEQRPEIVRAVIVNVGYVRRFLRDLQALGLVEQSSLAWAQTADANTRDTFDARIVARLSAEYLLRALQLLAEAYGDIRDGIIAHTIATTNTAHLDVRGGEGWRYAAIDETPPDEVRRPVSVARLAESLGLPFETTRGRVRRLMEAGICVRVTGGLIVPRAVLDRPHATRAALANVTYVRKFIRDLMAAGLASARIGEEASRQGAARTEGSLRADASA